MNHATMIAFEGLDCTFKETNTNKLYKYLKEKNYNVYKFSFPNYNSDSSYFVKEYLNGNYNKLKNNEFYDIVAEMFTLDRFDTFNKKMKDIYYNENNIIILDRWVKSNLYNAFRSEHNALSAIYDILNKEHIRYGLPIEDLTIYMNMPYSMGKTIRLAKKNLDINESNEKLLESLDKNYIEYFRLMESNYKNNIDCAYFKNIAIVDCANESEIYSEDKIFSDILIHVNKLLNIEGE